MALSVQNKNFLALLNRLDIDVKQFPDKTFDGLFENVPEIINHFFNWFIENITSDNVLTQSEQATYFQLESTHSLPHEDELDYALSSCNTDFEELMSLDVNYVNSFLPQDLDDLSKNYEVMSRVFKDLEKNLNEIKIKQSSLKEGVAMRKKKLGVAKEDRHNADILFASKLDDVKTFLLKELHFSIDLGSFHALLDIQENIFNKFTTCNLLGNKIFNSSKLDILPALENDVACIEISTVLSEGFLREKKTRIEFLTEFLQKKSLHKSFSGDNLMQSFLINNEGIDIKILEQIKILEREILDKVRNLSHLEIKKISDEYLLQKLDLNKCYIEKLNVCKEYVKLNKKMNLWLLHILANCLASVEDTRCLKKQLCSKLSEYERNFSNDLINFELRKQRFKEVSVQQNQHPLMLALKNVVNLEENPENNAEAFKNIYELMLHVTDDSSFVCHRFRSDLQSSIKMLFGNILCGPTSELLFAPAELVIKLQNCEECEGKLAQAVKRLASKYVEAKALILRNDRKKLLFWMDTLTKLHASQMRVKVNNSPES